MFSLQGLWYDTNNCFTLCFDKTNAKQKMQGNFKVLTKAKKGKVWTTTIGHQSNFELDQHHGNTIHVVGSFGGEYGIK
jgi:hypothetical protein